MIRAAAIIVPLVVYAALLLWRARVEDGWVGFQQPRTRYELAMLRFLWGFRHLYRVVGEVLLPAIEETTWQIGAWADTYTSEASET